jgi:proton glutamate symport protein
MPWYRKLHWQIILGLVLGLLFGLWAAAQGWSSWVERWVAPLGTVFINLLKLIAVPLVLASLIVGVTSLSDLRRLSRIGTKTILLYIITTTIAITLGLVLVNLLEPGHSVPADMRERLQSTYAADVEARAELAQQTRERGPLQLLIDIVPENVFNAAANNRNMLQVVFIALFSGIGLLLIPQEKARPVIAFFEGVNALVIRLVELIMRTAPVGVFALMAGTITSIAHDSLEQVLELLAALGYYSLTVLLGMLLHTLGTYPLLVKFIAGMPLKVFFGGIAPAQLVAFSTSSSGATLPVTMECAEKNLKIPEEISSFVLPLGATINMDGTALYQAVAAVFIAQALGLGLDLGAQLTILLTALLASIGTAAVPSAGIVMLVIILESVGVPSAGIALILGVDRILDMCRTVTNVTGDLTVASVVAAAEYKQTSSSPTAS